MGQWRRLAPLWVKAAARAYTWNNRLLHHEVPSIRALAREAKVSERYFHRLLPLACFVPYITGAILKGRAPADLTVERLISGIPHDWTAQRQRFGFLG